MIGVDGNEGRNVGEVTVTAVDVDVMTCGVGVVTAAAVTLALDGTGVTRRYQ